ncbi:MAG TPA: ATP-binding protein [Gemmatimonadaceae bacterium]|nr:ATP-binding protein [Gemmatimonadaceae bacterium]
MRPWHDVAGRTKRWARARLSRRLLAWFMVFSLVPLVVTNAVGYARSKAIIRRRIERDQSALAEVQALHVRDRADRALLLLQSIVAGNEFLVAGTLKALGLPAGEMGDVADRPAIEQLLRSKLAESGAFDALYLVVPDHRVIAAVGDSGAIVTTVPSDDSTRALTTRIRKLGRSWEPQFRLAVPLVSYREHRPQIIAYLGGAMSLNGFRDFLQLPPALAGHLDTYIVDEQGRPLFLSRPDDRVNYAARVATPLLDAKNGSFAQYTRADGATVIGTIVAVPGYPWRFVSELPTSEAFGELRRLGGLSLVLESVFVLTLILAAWLVSREIVVPLRQLVGATHRLAAGEADVRVAVTQHDEVGELGRAFNDMSGALATATTRMRELHQREIERASQLATVGELAAGVAHEIKNPVVGVAGGLDLVQRRLGRDTPLAPIIDEMARQLTRIQQALQDLLTFARPTTPTFAPASANGVVERAIRLVQPAADRGGVVISADLDPTAPHITADEEMIHQALVNVLMNAVQATPSGGGVTVSTRVASDDDAVEITVADTGRGIEPDKLEHVFKPFFTTRHTGTGLGLPITREIVQRHGGAIRIASTPGVGTTIVLRLPLRTTTSGAGAGATLEEAVR